MNRQTLGDPGEDSPAQPRVPVSEDGRLSDDTSSNVMLERLAPSYYQYLVPETGSTFSLRRPVTA